MTQFEEHVDVRWSAGGASTFHMTPADADTLERMLTGGAGGPAVLTFETEDDGQRHTVTREAVHAVSRRAATAWWALHLALPYEPDYAEWIAASGGDGTEKHLPERTREADRAEQYPSTIYVHGLASRPPLTLARWHQTVSTGRYHPSGPVACELVQLDAMAAPVPEPPLPPMPAGPGFGWDDPLGDETDAAIAAASDPRH